MTRASWAEMTLTERREAMVSVTGANADNATTAAGTDPYQPWSEKIMILAGTTGDGWPWLWLACRDCGWYLGYAPQHGLTALAEAGYRHTASCEQLRGEPR